MEMKRAQTGRYSGRHHTPGDGTGFTKLPEKQGRDVLRNVTPGAAPKTQPYPVQRKTPATT